MRTGRTARFGAPAPILGILGLSLVAALAGLRHERERQGLSLSDLAERTGIDRATISKLETGKLANPTIGTLRTYAKLCGWTLARAHARSGDPAVISGYLGNSSVFDEAVTKFAKSYADQTERDHKTLARAVAEGHLEAVTD